MPARSFPARRRAALALTALAALIASPAAHAAGTAGADPATPTDAVIAVNALIGTTPGHPVVSAAFSPDHARLSFRQAYAAPPTGQSTAAVQTANTDLWSIPTDGTQQPARLTNTEATTASGYTDGSGNSIVNESDAVWRPDSRGVAYVTFGPDKRSAPTTRVFTSTSAGDDWSGEHSYGKPGTASGLTFTPDGKYLVWRNASTGSADDYAVDLSTATAYFVRHLGAPTSPIWAPECATITEGSYDPPIHSGNDVVDALAGPNPGCKFGVAPDPIAATGTTPTALSGPSSTAPRVDDAPGVTAATGRSFTPISERLPSAVAAGPTLSITAVGKSLTAARKNGLHVKYTLDRLATVKAWVILKDSGARYELPSAFAGVPASTVARGTSASSKPGAGSIFLAFGAKGQSALKGANRLSLQLKMTATDVAGRSTIVVQSLTLRR